MYSFLYRTIPSSLHTIGNTQKLSFYRFFSKIYNFKTTYPVLYEHVHPDSLPLVDKEVVDSSTVVKWFCPKGPDHIWESDIASRVRSFKRRNNCK